MVTIRASHVVLPNESTPKGRIWLSDIDQRSIFLRHTFTIYIYKTKGKDEDAETIIERLRKSLSKVLVYYYPLVGQLLRIEGGQWEVDCNNTKGATLFEAETRKTLQDYGDFCPSESTKELVPDIDYSSKAIEEFPLLLVQVTRFHCNEGFAIGLALSHLLADGVAAIHFVNSWAKIARGEALHSSEMPFLDRTVLKFSSPSSAPRFDHHELKPLPLKLGASSNIDERKKKTCAALLKLSPEQVEKLKRKAINNNKEGSRPYSKYESIAAHIWQCASKARKLDENQPTLLRVSVDIRNRMIPPLPKNYFGNALALTATPTCLAGEIISNSLGNAASKIRKAIVTAANDDYIRSQIQHVLRSDREQLDKAKLPFGENQGVKSLFAGNPNLHITSWLTMPLYEADFGWGKPLYVGIPIVLSQDRVYILQSPSGDGSVHVLMYFQIQHMQLFKNFFYEDI